MSNEAGPRNTLVPLILRLALAVVFIYHGYDKIAPPQNSWGAEWLASLNLKLHMDPAKKIPDPVTFAAIQLAVAWGELGGGIAMLLGLLTRVAAIGLCLIQLGAISMILWAEDFDFSKFNFMKGGYEYNVVLVAVCLALLFSGAGKVSLDNLIFRKKEPASQQEPAPAPAGV